MPKIYLHIGPVRSGKTTSLLNWSDKKDNLYGFLTPDIDGIRRLLILPSKDLLRFELSEQESESIPNEEIVAVGKFKFYKRAFELANQLIDSQIPEHVEWILIDEIGKLELKELGFHKSIVFLLDRFNKNEIQANIIFIVRDYLLDDVLLKYKIAIWDHFNDQL